MGGKGIMKLPFPFKPNNQEQQQEAAAAAVSPWPWPTCGNPTKTLSFRSTNLDTFSSAFKDMGPTQESSSCSSSSSLANYNNPSDELDDQLHEDSVIHGLIRSERLFFEPGETSSILEEAKSKPSSVPNQESLFPLMKQRNTRTSPVVVEEMVSTNPYVDFKKSMEEMVEANQGIKESMEGLQELLSWYLTVNGKSNHGYIVGAFVDLLVSLSFANIQQEEEEEENHTHNSNSPTNSPISALSFSSSSSSSTSSTTRSTTPCLSCSMEGDHESSTSSEKTLVALDNASSSHEV